MGVGATAPPAPAMASSCPPILARLLACAALALALVPATASAQASLPVPAAEPLMTAAHNLAVARWGIEPCGGQVTVTWAHLGVGINARSQWMSIDVHDPTSFSQCAVAYNLDVSWDWPKLCTVIEHELGHLSGHDHVNDPHDVMSPYYVFPTPECAPAAAAPTTRPDAAPRKAAPVAASRRAAATRAAAKRKASAKRKVASKRNAKSQRSRTKRRGSSKPRKTASLALATTDFSRVGFFGCVLVAGR
jgi:hypothetical protein